MNLNRYIDHTLLRPDATPEDIERFCREAYDYNFHAAVVNPVYVPMVSKMLRDSEVKACSVVAFPLGAGHTEFKIAEAVRAEAEGAREIDVVANIGWLQSGRFNEASKEMSDIRKRLSPDTVLKVIIETPLLKPQLWKEAAEAVILSGAEYVKTATGFFGATTRRHVEQLREYCGIRIKIKAAGGIRSASEAVTMIMAGAHRIGSSSSVAIMDSLQKNKN